MTVTGVSTDEIVACVVRFAGFPEGAPTASASSSWAEVGGPSGLVEAAEGFAGAWGRAGGVVAADEGEFVTRLRRAAALYVEADAALADASRKAA